MKRRAFVQLAMGAAAASVARWPLHAAEAAAANPIADLRAVTGTGKQIVVPRGAVAELRSGLRGALLLQGDAGYDNARHIWNGAFDRHPALIARCEGASDVIQAVNFARQHELLVAVRGGGHSLSGQSVCDAGLMIDLSPMKSVQVDPVARLARVEPGVALGQFDREAQFFGLATTAGTVSDTGVAGLTLGGGFGRLARKYALACDNLESADVICADGKLRHASAEVNPDLFWGLHGGGGNFGIVTAFQFRLHSVGPIVYSGTMLYDTAQRQAVMRAYADFAAQAPDELNADAGLGRMKDGRSVFYVEVCYCGPLSQADTVLAPLRRLKPIRDTLKPMPYVEVQSAGDPPWGQGVYEKSGFLRSLTPELIDHIIELNDAATIASASIDIVHHGGAMGRVAPTATPFGHRDARHSVFASTDWAPGDKAAAEAATRWTLETWAALEKYTEGFYVNTLAEDDTARRIQSNYGINYERLVQVKTRFDPGNLFRRNANVPPKARA